MEPPSGGAAAGEARTPTPRAGPGESAPDTPAEGTPGRAGGGEELPPRLGLSAQRAQRGAMSLGEAALLPFPHLSGAVDVVAVRQADGSIKCSPFYVRFGKYQGLLRRRDKMVKIHVNGQEVPLNMYVGRTGEAYFVQPVEGGLGAAEGEGGGTGDLPAYTVANHSYLLGGGAPSSVGAGWPRSELGDSDAGSSHGDVQPPELPGPAGGAPPRRPHRSLLAELADTAASGKPPAPGARLAAAGSDDLVPATVAFSVEANAGSASEGLAGGGSMGSDAAGGGGVGEGGGATSALEEGGELDEAKAAAAPAQGSGGLSAVADAAAAAAAAASEPEQLCWSADSAQSFRKLLHTKGLQALQGMELSLCASELVDGMLLEDARELFSQRRVSRRAFLKKNQGVGLAADAPESRQNLVCKVEGWIFRWADLAPLVLGLLAFGEMGEGILQDAAVLKNPVPRLSSKKEGWSWSWWFSRSEKANKEAEDARNLSETARELVAADVPSLERASAPAVLEGPEPSHDSEEPSSLPGSALLEDSALLGTEQWRKSFNLLPEQLQLLPLVEGRNEITYTCRSSLWGLQSERAFIFLYPYNSKLVISDIDGTITKSDVLGQILPHIGRDWSQSGITKFLSKVEQNGYDVIYLSARAIGQASLTRDYLLSVSQGGEKLPPGPLIISPDGLLPSLYREVIQKRPHDFKIACLADIRELFPPDWNPFFAGMGNKNTDEMSYEAAGVPKGRILTINPKGAITIGGHRQLGDSSSLDDLTPIVDQMFPPRTAQTEGLEEEYSDYNFWTMSDLADIEDPNLA